MIGILVATHSPLASSLIESCKMIMGDHILNCRSICLTLGEDLENYETEFVRHLDELDEGEGVLVLVDLFAGTPANIAMRGLKHRNYECVSGVNLGMLLEVLSSRTCQSLDILKKTAFDAGRETIVDISGKVKG